MQPETATIPDTEKMEGTDGHLDYLLLARRGNMGLGFKLLGLRPSRSSKTVRTAFRLRSAPLPHTDSAVVSLQDAKLTTETAWPGIEWEKKDTDRCSLVCHIDEPLDTEDVDQVSQFCDRLSNGEAAQKYLETLFKQVDPDHLIASQIELLTRITEHFLAPIAAKLLEHVKFKKALEQAESESVGQVVTSGVLLKKAKAMVDPDPTPDTAN